METLGRSAFATGLAKEIAQRRAKTMALDSRGWRNRDMLIERVTDFDPGMDTAERMMRRKRGFC